VRSRVIWRRSATAIGTYVAAGLGFFTTVVATRELGVHDYARFAAVIAATGFFQLLLDLTIEEALVKFGFRYVEAQRWGRLRRLFEVAVGFKLAGGMLAALAVCALAPFADDIWGSGDVVVPMLIASLLPLAQAPENVAAGAIIPRPLRPARRVPRSRWPRLGARDRLRYGWSAPCPDGLLEPRRLAAIGAAGIAARASRPRRNRSVTMTWPARVPLLLDPCLLARLRPRRAAPRSSHRRADRRGHYFRNAGAGDRVRGASGRRGS
jgi:hypothetical protein